MNRRPLRSRLLATVLGGALRGGPALAAGLAVVSAGGCQLRAVTPALPENATPPPFTLASTGGTLDSAAALAKGPLVLIFYRGHW